MTCNRFKDAESTYISAKMSTIYIWYLLAVDFCVSTKFLCLSLNVVDCFRGEKIMLKVSVQQTKWLVTTMPSRRSWD